MRIRISKAHACVCVHVCVCVTKQVCNHLHLGPYSKFCTDDLSQTKEKMLMCLYCKHIKSWNSSLNCFFLSLNFLIA